MRHLALIIAVLALAPAWAQTALDPTTLYISDPLKWERGQRPGQTAPKLAFASILVMEPNGSLAMISCYLNKSPDKRLDLLYQSGFGLASGTWKKAARQMAVRFRSIHSDARRVDATDRQYKEESWTYAPSRKGDRLAEWIKAGNTRYIPLQNLSEFDKLAEMVRFYRKAAEGSE
jgi:hypothetical protein